MRLAQSTRSFLVVAGCPAIIGASLLACGSASSSGDQVATQGNAPSMGTHMTGDAGPSSTPDSSVTFADSGADQSDADDSGFVPADSGTSIHDAGGPTTDAGNWRKDSGATPHDAGSAPQDAGTSPVGTFMPAPTGWSYSQLVWETQFGYNGMGTAPSAANQGTFVSNGVPKPNTSVGLLNDWNYGVQQQANAVWYASGSFPYWGSSQGASGEAADYSFPGNVFQTSTGANASLFGGYSPQTFSAGGTGLTLADQYVGSKSISADGNYPYSWTSAVLNTEGKRYFPFGGATEFFAQVSAKLAGPNTGSWSAIWTLPDQGENGTGQEIDIQEYNVSGPNEYAMYSHVQEPAEQIGNAKASTPLCDGYHVYGWHVNSATQTLTLYLDGVETGTFTGAQVGTKYYLILDAAISGGGDSWQSQEGFVTDNNADMALGIAEVQVYQP